MTRHSHGKQHGATASEDTSTVQGPDEVHESGIDVVLARYIRFANRRDLDGLLDLYAESPVISLEGEAMAHDLQTNMRRAVRAWKDVNARFKSVEVESLDIDGDTATVDCVIPSRGRLFAFSKHFNFHKHLELTKNGQSWRIVKDDTREAGIVGRVLKMAGVI